MADDAVLAIRSTLPPDFIRQLPRLLRSIREQAGREPIAAVVNPEFTREGAAIRDYPRGGAGHLRHHRRPRRPRARSNERAVRLEHGTGADDAGNRRGIREARRQPVPGNEDQLCQRARRTLRRVWRPGRPGCGRDGVRLTDRRQVPSCRGRVRRLVPAEPGDDDRQVSLARRRPLPAARRGGRDQPSAANRLRDARARDDRRLPRGQARRAAWVDLQARSPTTCATRRRSTSRGTSSQEGPRVVAYDPMEGARNRSAELVPGPGGRLERPRSGHGRRCDRTRHGMAGVHRPRLERSSGRRFGTRSSSTGGARWRRSPWPRSGSTTRPSAEGCRAGSTDEIEAEQVGTGRAVQESGVAAIDAYSPLRVD